MTRTHFIALAKCIHANREHFDATAVESLISFCRTFNPNFDADKFIEYINKGGK